MNDRIILKYTITSDVKRALIYFRHSYWCFYLPDYAVYKANVAIGWISPLNHATYHMHNFGYDLPPRLWQTYALFGVLIILCFLLALRGIRRYNFNFTGTEG